VRPAMDIYCPRCGEPWDIDSLHGIEDDETGESLAYDEVARRFARYGCAAMEGYVARTTCTGVDNDLTLAARVAVELSPHPDDWASDLEDLRYLGGF
jgi:hypothetical protein